jgi:hypothetical protein
MMVMHMLLASSTTATAAFPAMMEPSMTVMMMVVLVHEGLSDSSMSVDAVTTHMHIRVGIDAHTIIEVYLHSL